MSDFYDYYGYHKPIRTKSGIKSRTARGRTFGASWWARRWVTATEECIDAGRMARGKSYARQGQVMAINIEKGLVTATVQGSSHVPYKVRLKFETVSKAARKAIFARIRMRAIYGAQLLAGVMPSDLEEIFKDAGAPLFLTKEAFRRFNCTCPDVAIPCKHIVAVLLLMAEELDADPFLLLRLRGIEKEELISLLTLEEAESDEEAGGKQDSSIEEKRESGAPPQEERASLEEDVPQASEDWYAGGDFSFEPAEPRAHAAAALDVMNDFPFWRGEAPFRQMLEPCYEGVQGLELRR